MKELEKTLYEESGGAKISRRGFLKLAGAGFLAAALGTGVYSLGPVREWHLKRKDSDGDGLSDWEETDNPYRTSPYNSDTDGDGFSDSDEIRIGSNPLNSVSTPDMYPKQKKLIQKEWIERYNKAYGANLTPDDLPLPQEKTVYRLRMYENIDFVEPRIEGPENFQNGMRRVLDFIKEKSYVDYVYVCKNTKKIEYTPGSQGNDHTEQRVFLSQYLESKQYYELDEDELRDMASTVLHETVHLEDTILTEYGIVEQDVWCEAYGISKGKAYGISKGELIAQTVEYEFEKTSGKKNLMPDYDPIKNFKKCNWTWISE